MIRGASGSTLVRIVFPFFSHPEAVFIPPCVAEVRGASTALFRYMTFFFVPVCARMDQCDLKRLPWRSHTGTGYGNVYTCILMRDASALLRAITTKFCEGVIAEDRASR